ncbi:MAG: chromophore lyase CpcT/CpeT [Microcoleus sp. PH2017_10_PVI_O_A]|uniref:chromophore lyase CpcT/CpeT n=1 Tax=unclassified Microcoleus TaxID=2642155 RepID=UPI001D228A34|nr:MULTISPECIES: chromophore lyase CpcT/CpeT [unclassified Microcoleus]TAE79446.1 MAG: chorismate-binding protein [Oscillatoriales cyanobacterium]MCC3408261.1 chromophore lyase CpcT/CpeT [Microcoleus sp. PH2017_10_PVI_O_A]MCC3461647.1 chromophore lyase CpcT/CpeT [Microcoleus sp. PH2017_11_PCY_U_A]MCC3480825.1 chromophore lyase CpcT/CpeT [Microcoleus sp. PH2017_12_PCY_D_A]MCC3528946.1 chromophore lyase CpcT/CpeT [Microcoleus sp. PH2017_21_RUC_O_A]
MTHSTDIVTLARWMAADFSNQPQAFENPPFFAHIRVCMRPLPVELLGGMSLYLEQAYDIELHVPYRVRVLKLVPAGDRIDIENYAIENEAQFYGASRQPQRLQEIKTEQLTLLPGCTFFTHWTGNSFKGSVEPGKGCAVVRNGKQTYLDSEFEIDGDKFISHDRGRDPETDAHVWGALAGPFEFTRWASFADEIPV